MSEVAFSSKKILKNGFWIYLFSYLGAPLGYLTRMLISRDTSVEELGFLYSLIGFIGLLSAYNGLGLTEALKYFIPKYLAEKKIDEIKTALILSLISQLVMGVFIVLGLYFGSEYLAEHYFKDSQVAYFLQLSCWYFLGTNVLQILTAIFLGFQDTFSSKVMELIQSFVILCSTLGVFFLEKGEILTYGAGRLLGLILGVGVGLFLYFKKYHHRLTQGKWKREGGFLRTFLNYSLWTFLSMNSGILLGAIDQQMIISILGAHDAGIYANYLSMIGVFTIGITPLWIMLVPTFTALLSQGAREKLNFFKTKLYSYVLVFSLSLSFFLFVLAPDLTSLLYGEAYLESGFLLRFSVFFYTLNVLATLNFTLLSALGKVKAKTLLTIGVGILNILLNYLLIHRFGIYGSLYSTILGWIVLAGVSFFLLEDERPRLQWDFLLRNTLLFMVLALGLWGTNVRFKSDFLNFSSLGKIGIVASLFVLYYGLIIVANRSEVKGALHLLRRKE